MENRNCFVTQMSNIIYIFEIWEDLHFLTKECHTDLKETMKLGEPNTLFAQNTRETLFNIVRLISVYRRAPVAQLTE